MTLKIVGPGGLQKNKPKTECQVPQTGEKCPISFLIWWFPGWTPRKLDPCHLSPARHVPTERALREGLCF